MAYSAVSESRSKW